MSEWPNQITEYQRNWVEQQQKLLTDWLETMKNATGDPSRASWRKAADLMEQQVDSGLDAQKSSLMAFAQSMEKVEGAPEVFTQAVKQLEEGLEQWAEVQHRMWHVWFDMVRAAAPAPQTPGQAMIENWEDMVKRTMAIQTEWLSSWPGSLAPSGKASAAGSTESTGSRKSSSAPR